MAEFFSSVASPVFVGIFVFANDLNVSILYISFETEYSAKLLEGYLSVFEKLVIILNPLHRWLITRFVKNGIFAKLSANNNSWMEESNKQDWDKGLIEFNKMLFCWCIVEKMTNKYSCRKKQLVKRWLLLWEIQDEKFNWK